MSQDVMWHRQDISKVYERLGSSEQGISAAEAAERLEQYGFNELEETRRKTLLMMFLDQFRDFMIVVLIAAAVISGIIGEVVDTIAIVVIVVLNAIIGFVQEYRAEQAMKALKDMAAPSALALRDGAMVTVPAADLVPGDVVYLEAGVIVPADIRLADSARLKIEEAALTGESVPVEKSAAALGAEQVPLGDRTNMAYKGTVVSYGRGSGVVVATGMKTELGRIASMLQEEDEVKTPLQKRLARFGQRLGIVVIAICAIVFITGLMRGETPLLMFLTAVSLAVAAIPEALPAVVTISLAIGARKMVRQNALVRKLPAVETLGSVTYICSDKTGTLTLNRMSVEELFADGKIFRVDDQKSGAEEADSGTVPLPHFPASELLKAMALNNDAVQDAGGSSIGDPTEIALFECAERLGVKKADALRDFPRIAEIPFDSERKCMTTFHSTPEGGVIAFSKGALETVLNESSHNLVSGEAREITDAMKTAIEEAGERLAGDGLRTLAFAFRMWDGLPEDMTPEHVERGLTFVGLAGLMDPPREEAKEAVRVCKDAGIKPVMITGDHPLTAKNIARRLGIVHDGDGVMTGQELDRLTLEEFEEKVETVRVYARVAPEQKIKIVKALQDKGEFAAMTGDGVNDAPALKRADIGVAMGITGTDVSKESSHMILLDDNFATIVKAVKEGRRIFDNIRKFIRYTMTSNSGEIWTIFLAPFLGLPIPLLPIHILWVNLVTDGLPGLAYAVEPAGANIMKRPPRHPQENIFAGMWFPIIWIGLLMGGVTIFTQAWAIGRGYDQARWQTMVFTVLCLSQMGNAFSIRSERRSFFELGMFTNMSMVYAVSLTFVLQMAVIYVPFLNPVFKTAPLGAADLAFTLLISCIVFAAAETEKWWLRKRGL